MKTKMRLTLIITFLTLSINISYGFIGKNGSHEAVLGVGYTSLHHDFDDYGQSTTTPSLGYYYGRDKQFFPAVDLHFFKKALNGQSFSSKSINMAIGYNIFSIDNFHFAPSAGLGFYLPSAKRLVGGVLKETDSKLVFGVNLGVETYLRLNDKFGFSFKLHYHNPFDVSQEIGKELEGHYTITSINLSKVF